jgi:two-component system, chemotaxis family, chemotaxis protein CheY
VYYIERGDIMKVLIVDDSKAMRMIIKRTLRQAGYDECTTEEATTGSEALGMIQQAPPDLLFVDWNMPGMTGIELIENMKKNYTSIKFGFVTSEGTPEMRLKAEESGASFFISKPFTVETFQDALAGIMS